MESSRRVRDSAEMNLKDDRIDAVFLPRRETWLFRPRETPIRRGRNEREATTHLRLRATLSGGPWPVPNTIWAKKKIKKKRFCLVRALIKVFFDAPRELRGSRREGDVNEVDETYSVCFSSLVETQANSIHRCRSDSPQSASPRSVSLRFVSSGSLSRRLFVPFDIDSLHSTSVGSFRHRFATALSVPFDIDSVHLRTGSFRHRFRVDPNLGSQSSSYVGLLNSQQVSRVDETSGEWEIPPFSSQQAEHTPVDTPVDRNARRKWSPADDAVLISAWLNTSKDAVVGNEQKLGAFWKRVGDYYAAIEYFKPKEDATGRSGLSPLQKCTAAIRQLAYGGGADPVDEYIRLAETTSRKCLHEFTAGIIHLFADEYLRRPTVEDLRRLLHEGEERGFPGMIGSIDCMHWEWKNCPTAWKGMYSRGTGKPTIVLEAVASYDLWIWHAFFGAPGTLNDLNILDRSPVFDEIINGKAPQVNYYVNGREYNLAYYLTDGIYPKWANFIQSIRLPQGAKNSLFATRQESIRKDVERAFGVLQARFAVVRNPSDLWDKNKISNIMRACLILHNMNIQDEQNSDTLEEFQDDDFTFTVKKAKKPGNIIARRKEVRDPHIHQQLKEDLIEHI
uniref:DDE Tnp4 domain-containing protein n=1 Tax=Brassica oleracea var. oleracea TaxID=109376 RepID=A0A0D3EFA3_BRAOL